jgi:type II secretory pathway pseudopilin PulG
MTPNQVQRIGIPHLRPSKRERRRPNGFTSIESIIALILLTIIGLGVMSEVVVVRSADKFAGEQTRAVALAARKLEELKALPPASVVTESAKAVDVNGNEGSGPYRRWVNVADGADGRDTKTVTVSVEYPTGSMGRQLVELTTIIYSGN